MHGRPPPRSVPIRDWPAISTTVLKVHRLSDIEARAKFLDLGDRVNAFIEAIDREDSDFLESAVRDRSGARRAVPDGDTLLASGRL